MTTVYGVTYVGAREQIERQLREKPDIHTDHRYKISAYVAKKVSPCITVLFFSTKANSNRDPCRYRRSIQWCQGYPDMAHNLR